MNINALLLSLGLPGFFSSRAFTPAFLTALVLRYGDSLPWLKNVEFLQSTGAEPTWFTNNWTILALGCLAVVEIAATKFPEAEELLATVHKYGKTGMTFVTSMGILSATDRGFVEGMITAGFMDQAWAALVAAGTFVLTSVRNGVFALITESDPDDDLGIRGLLSWFEDTWGTLGVLLIFIYPFIMLAVVGLFMAGLFGIRTYAEHREEKTKVACGSCSQPMYASALHCPHCGEVNPAPKAVGLFGQSLPRKPAPEAARQARRLASKRRCPRCATRLPERTTDQCCPACGTAPFGAAAFREEYTAMVTARLPKVLLISALFSLVPVFGTIPGIIYYRFALIAPFRGYIPAGQNFLMRWFLRFLFLFLITLQAIPVAGAAMVPLMALLSYLLYRGAFASKLSATPLAA